MSNPNSVFFSWSRSIAPIARWASCWASNWAAGRQPTFPACPADAADAASASMPGASSPSADRANVNAQSLPVPHGDAGLPAQPVEELLQANGDMLARIKLCYGADQELFEREVLPLVRRYAEFVHLLPATPDNYFAEPGGLLRLGLEVGFFALQGTDGHIFSGRATITARKHLEPRWRQATFIAGLCGELHVAMGRVLVTDAGGAQWTPYISDLSHWLAEQPTGRYFLKWVQPEASVRALGLFALRHVVPPQTLQYLASGNTVIVPHLLGSVSGVPMYRGQGGEHNVLDELVRRAFALVVDRNLRACADRSGRVQLGAHVERYLVDAMRRLVAGGAAWTPNTERSRLWFGSDGLYMVWPQAAADIGKLLEADQTPGMPRDPAVLANLLVQAGIVTPRSQQEITWNITPPLGKVTMEALRLTAPEVLLSGLPRDPAPLPQRLEVSSPAANCVASAGPENAVNGEADKAVHKEADCEAPQLAPSPELPGELDANKSALAHLATVLPPLASDASMQGSEPVGTASSGLDQESDESQQLSLLDDAEGAIKGEAHVAAPALQEPTPPTFALDAPMRLDSAVREALAAAIASLNVNRGDAAVEPGACMVPAGVFVPLHEFERRGVEPPTAVRLLAELSMLTGSVSDQAVAGSAHRLGKSKGTEPIHGKTVVRDFAGKELIGVIVRPRFVAGLDPAQFEPHTPC